MKEPLHIINRVSKLSSAVACELAIMKRARRTALILHNVHLIKAMLPEVNFHATYFATQIWSRSSLLRRYFHFHLNTMLCTKYLLEILRAKYENLLFSLRLVEPFVIYLTTNSTQRKTMELKIQLSIIQ